MNCPKCNERTVWREMGKLKVNGDRIAIEECTKCGYTTRIKIIRDGQKK